MSEHTWRHHPNYSIDPCPTIKPALLNSVDIKHYADTGCLLTAFDPEHLNPASYTMCLLGTLYWWDRKGKRLVQRKQTVTHQTPVKLRRNSISYLYTEQQFKLPQYIAARFNLHIRYVHKGILLGTGPLVDPGFDGSLLIPLHNLTDNDYHIDGGDPIVWVEFTKLSPHEYWERSEEQLHRATPDGLVTLRDHKHNLRADDYFKKALQLPTSATRSRYGVQSAFKGALDSALASVSEAKAVSRTVRNWGLGTAAALVIGMFALTIAAVQLIVNANAMNATTRNLIVEFESRIYGSEGALLSPRTTDTRPQPNSAQQTPMRAPATGGRIQQVPASNEDAESVDPHPVETH